jgi:hypothetical protein
MTVGPGKRLAWRNDVHGLDGITGAKIDCTAPGPILPRQLYDLFADIIERF